MAPKKSTHEESTPQAEKENNVKPSKQPGRCKRGCLAIFCCREYEGSHESDGASQSQNDFRPKHMELGEEDIKFEDNFSKEKAQTHSELKIG